MKKSIACTSCRFSKRRCINTGQPPCDRCRDRGDECIFPPHGASSPASQRARPARRELASSSSHLGRVKSQVQTPSTVATPPSLHELAIGAYVSQENPFGYFTDEVKSCYVRCSYKWSFHHIPTLLSSIHKETLDPALAWAILAIAIRFSQAPPAGYSSQIEASNAFAAVSRSLVLPHVDDPNVHRIQVLLLLTGHSWGAGEGKRAWVFLGMAVRMAQSLGLFEENTPNPSPEAFILLEERRRTAWTCYLMDSLLSGGKGRERSLSADKMMISLPCDSESFSFGEPVRCLMLDGSVPPGPGIPMGELNVIACSMQVADIWGDVAKWACSPHSENEPPPWDPQSSLQILLSRLERWRVSLPPRLQYKLSNLRSHTVSNQGQAFAYMHCIYFLSVTLLYRSYLPEVDIRQPSSRPAEWERWSAWSSKEVASVSEKICEMLHEMRGFGLFFLRGLVPWVGFAIYTAVGALLFFVNFPTEDASDARIMHWRSCIVEGCHFLKEMRQAWPMADTWRNTVQRMQFFYTNIKARGSSAVSSTERTAMRDAVTDYGALMPQPVGQDEPVTIPEHARATVTSTDSRAITENPIYQVEQPQPEVMEYPEPEQYSLDIPLLIDSDASEMSIDIDGPVPPMFVDATHVFWESFPGETEH